MQQKATKVLGIIFVLVGILGFIPGVTSNGHLLGIFEVDMIHNIIHLVTGLIALGVAKSADNSKKFLQIFGVIYAIIAVLGFLGEGGDVLGVASNSADTWLHVVTAIIFLYLGFGGGKSSAPAGPSAPAAPTAPTGGQS
ncbi:hypothetical protein CL634_04330 [bacterium]|nr:hypothetical protein [bacterium]|tara:strand:+ start:1262 stop:1678 length:417 start_codon:yes stop_codon:yes gene_type:complete